MVGAQSGLTSYSFAYNGDGLRISKTRTIADSDTTYYLYDGTTLIAEYSDSYTIVFIYDAAGSPIGMRYRSASFASEVWETYWYEKNLQGDIVAVYSNDGIKLISYIYDAWGNCETLYDAEIYNHNAERNPFKYRGYYYDSDLGLYYLQSRYYDPVTGRFINADGLISSVGGELFGNNLYVYCFNNPVMGIDYSGFWTFSLNMTVFVGIFGGGYSASVALSVDSQGYCAFQWTYSVPNNDETRNTVFGVSAVAGIGMQVTNLDTVDELNGISKNVGFNTSIAGIDAVMTKQNETIGAAIGIGRSIGGDVHINEVQTVPLGSKFKSLIEIFKGWFGFE